jgi:serine/threonine protein kinase
MTKCFIPGKLDHYVFLTPLQDSLWLGRDKRSNSAVLIRALDIDISESALFQFKLETGVLRLIDSPLFARLHEIIEHDSYIYIISDAPHSTTLKDYITKHGPVSEAKAQEFLGELGDAVRIVGDHMTAPFLPTIESVYVSENCSITQIYLDIQFPMASSTSRPPELVAKQRLHCTSEVWVLGVFLYYLTVGRMPFGGGDGEIDQLILNSHAAIPDTLPPDLASLVAKMFLKNPLTRISIEEIATHPWMRSAPQSARAPFEKRRPRLEPVPSTKKDNFVVPRILPRPETSIRLVAKRNWRHRGGSR